MSNPCLDTTTSACNHWLAVKCDVILCLYMSRKKRPCFLQHFQPFFSLIFPLLLLLHYYDCPHTAGLVNSLISHLLQKAAVKVSYNSQVFPTGWLCKVLKIRTGQYSSIQRPNKYFNISVQIVLVFASVPDYLRIMFPRQHQ